MKYYCAAEQIQNPSKSLRRRIYKLCETDSRKAVNDNKISYDNLLSWKSTKVDFYGKTNGEIMKEAMENNWLIVNIDESQLPLTACNANTKTVCIKGQRGKKDNYHGEKVTILMGICSDDSVLPPVVVTSRSNSSLQNYTYYEFDEVTKKCTFHDRTHSKLGVYRRKNPYFKKEMMTHCLKNFILPWLIRKVKKRETKKVLLTMDNASVITIYSPFYFLSFKRHTFLVSTIMVLSLRVFQQVSMYSLEVVNVLKLNVTRLLMVLLMILIYFYPGP